MRREQRFAGLSTAHPAVFQAKPEGYEPLGRGIPGAKNCTAQGFAGLCAGLWFGFLELHIGTLIIRIGSWCGSDIRLRRTKL